MKDIIKKSFLAWFVFSWTVLLIGLTYAAFTNFTDLWVATWETLTADKWNNLVDAVKDEYELNETITNKIWLWKPVYRKVIDCGSFAWNKNCPTNISGVDLMWVADFVENDWAGQISGWASSHYITWTQARMVYITAYNQIYIQWYSAYTRHFYVTVEYTKI